MTIDLPDSNEAGIVEGIGQRIAVLNIALQLESLTSLFLSHLLGLPDGVESISFGNKSSSLSYNAKINLLIDIGALENSTRSKFQAFMEVRNQFMHNIKADSFDACLTVVEKDKFVLKHYPQEDGLTKEEMLEKATIDLGIDLLKTTADLIKKVYAKKNQELDAAWAIKSHKAFQRAIQKVEAHINESVKSIIENRTEIQNVELDGLGSEVVKILHSNWFDEMGLSE